MLVEWIQLRRGQNMSLQRVISTMPGRHGFFCGCDCAFREHFGVLWSISMSCGCCRGTSFISIATFSLMRTTANLVLAAVEEAIFLLVSPTRLTSAAIDRVMRCVSSNGDQQSGVGPIATPMPSMLPFMSSIHPSMFELRAVVSLPRLAGRLSFTPLLTEHLLRRSSTQVVC